MLLAGCQSNGAPGRPGNSTQLLSGMAVGGILGTVAGGASGYLSLSQGNFAPLGLLPFGPMVALHGDFLGDDGGHAAPQFGWGGGVLQEEDISEDSFLSNPAEDQFNGYGLYVYELPGELVEPDVLTSIATFDCLDLRPVANSEQDTSKIGLMVLPVNPGTQKGTAGHIDLKLADELLTASVADPDESRVYIVVSEKPLFPGFVLSSNLKSMLVIKLGFVAAPYVRAWLIRLREQIEKNKISSPSDFDLKLQSVFYAIGSTGQLIGLKVAFANTSQPTCQ